MNYVIVGGYGMQAQAIGQYLLEFTRDIVVIVDNGPEPANGFHKGCPQRVDLCPSVHEAVKLYDEAIIISCLPTQHNPWVAELAAQYNHHYIDLGGQLEDTERVITHWEELVPDATCIPDCGVAPGLVSTIIGNYLRTQDVKDIKIYCGGIPKYPCLYEPHRYGVTFNPEGVIKEYTGLVQAVEGGRIVHHAALDGLEEIFVDGLGYLEAVHMSGSLSKTPELLAVRPGQSYSYKTLRWPGHWKWVKENVLTQPDPNEIITQVIPRITQDYLVLMAVVDGVVLWQKVWTYDPKTKLTGMQQATGYTVGAVATMVADGSFDIGVKWMHDVNFTELWKRIP
jgi:saccharopine dehydrogenase-like NADP-dependent oxidoreductase